MVTLDVFADVACPWCFIGRRRLQAAIAAREPGTVAVRHRTFQLQPELPPEGVPMAEFFAAKFGSWERVRAGFERVAAEGASEGIAFDFDAMGKAPNTLLAHRAIALAREQGAEDLALEALYLAYFSEGRDVTDPQVLVARLAEAGLPDPAALAAGLTGAGGLPAVAEDLDLARAWEVTAVPLFVADRSFAVPGAQPAELLERLIAHAQGERAPA